MKDQEKIIASATQKINDEIKAFRELQKKQPGEKIYRNAMTIMFYEACANYTLALMKKNTNISCLIVQQHASLDGCAKSIIKMAQKIGNLGDISKADFCKAIWDYYQLDHAKIYQQEQEAKIKAKAREDMIKKRTISTKKTSVASSGDDKQISLFGGM